ncbi:MAG: hypothetical protein QX197_09220, partial [Methylococcaceae bacterium]
NNHVFMSIYAVFKLECLKIKHKANHFALRTKLFIKANQMAYAELQKIAGCVTSDSKKKWKISAAVLMEIRNK